MGVPPLHWYDSLASNLAPGEFAFWQESESRSKNVANQAHLKCSSKQVGLFKIQSQPAQSSNQWRTDPANEILATTLLEQSMPTQRCYCYNMFKPCHMSAPFQVLNVCLCTCFESSITPLEAKLQAWWLLSPNPFWCIISLTATNAFLYLDACWRHAPHHFLVDLCDWWHDLGTNNKTLCSQFLWSAAWAPWYW